MAYVAIGCRFLLGVVFAIAVVGKLRAPGAFADSLVLVGQRWRRPLGVAVIAAEFVTVVLLAVTPVAGVVAAAALLTVLTAGILWAIRRRVGARCRCFGGTDEALGRVHVVRNGALLAVAALGFVAGTPGPVQVGGVAVAVATGALFGLLVVRLDDVVDLFRTTVH